MRSQVDPSRGATVIFAAYTDVTEHSGVKSGIVSEENVTGERSSINEISMVDNSLRISLSQAT